MITNFEKIEEFCELIKKYQNTLIIVEGLKDKKALEAFGFKKIKTLNKALYLVVEEVKEKRVLILTDLDQKGKQLYRKLNSAFSSRGLFVDNTLRDFLFKNTKIKYIENLTKESNISSRKFLLL